MHSIPWNCFDYMRVSVSVNLSPEQSFGMMRGIVSMLWLRNLGSGGQRGGVYGDSV